MKNSIKTIAIIISATAICACGNTAGLAGRANAVVITEAPPVHILKPIATVLPANRGEYNATAIPPVRRSFEATPLSQPGIAAAPAQPTLLSMYKTEFSPSATSRNTNIKKAASSINGKVVMPGEIFSFNNTIGPTSKARGYKLARVFHKGQERKGYGGGVCQVSSTLYNAADEAGMEIVERHPHSRRVYYVPKGRDAATSYGSSDFKFRNNYNFPVVIVTQSTDDSLTVQIYRI